MPLRARIPVVVGALLARVVDDQPFHGDRPVADPPLSSASTRACSRAERSSRPRWGSKGKDVVITGASQRSRDDFHFHVPPIPQIPLRACGQPRTRAIPRLTRQPEPVPRTSTPLRPDHWRHACGGSLDRAIEASSRLDTDVVSENGGILGKRMVWWKLSILREATHVIDYFV
jgi:hypothetical protein